MQTEYTIETCKQRNTMSRSPDIPRSNRGSSTGISDGNLDLKVMFLRPNVAFRVAVLDLYQQSRHYPLVKGLLNIPKVDGNEDIPMLLIW